VVGGTEVNKTFFVFINFANSPLILALWYLAIKY